MASRQRAPRLEGVGVDQRMNWGDVKRGDVIHRRRPEPLTDCSLLIVADPYSCSNDLIVLELFDLDRGEMYGDVKIGNREIDSIHFRIERAEDTGAGLTSRRVT